jgi:hypothetical protein
MKTPDKNAAESALIWEHALAVCYSPAYLTENADGIKQDWPRIPLPDNRELLEASAKLGRAVADLLDADNPAPGVASGKIRPELRVMGAAAAADGKSLNPDAGDLDLTAGWGHAGKAGAVMPGKGKLFQRPWSKDEMEAIKKGAGGLGLSLNQALTRLGKDAVDVYLNDRAYWKGVPVAVWEYYIGGYQVMKKWLSYREKDILGRGLTMEETEFVTAIVRRLAALRLLEPSLDDNYEKVKANTFVGPSD